MAWQTDTDHDEAPIAIMLSHVPETVRRIGQSMEEHDETDRLAVRLHHVGAIPIVIEVRRINRTRLEVAINRHAITRWEFLAYLGTNARHNLVLAREVASPVCRVNL